MYLLFSRQMRTYAEPIYKVEGVFDSVAEAEQRCPIDLEHHIPWTPEYQDKHVVVQYWRIIFVPDAHIRSLIGLEPYRILRRYTDKGYVEKPTDATL